MRKEYVKPVMESEAFVSNEYVAACSTIACMNCDAVGTKYESASDVKNGLNVLATGSEGTIYQYTEKLGGKDPCDEYSIEKKPSWIENIYTGNSIFSLEYAWEEVVWAFYKALGGDSKEVTSFHPVTVKEGWDNHPNASV